MDKTNSSARCLAFSCEGTSCVSDFHLFVFAHGTEHDPRSTMWVPLSMPMLTKLLQSCDDCRRNTVESITPQCVGASIHITSIVSTYFRGNSEQTNHTEHVRPRGEFSRRHGHSASLFLTIFQHRPTTNNINKFSFSFRYYESIPF